METESPRSAYMDAEKDYKDKKAAVESRHPDLGRKYWGTWAYMFRQDEFQKDDEARYEARRRMERLIDRGLDEALALEEEHRRLVDRVREAMNALKEFEHEKLDMRPASETKEAA